MYADRLRRVSETDWPRVRLSQRRAGILFAIIEEQIHRFILLYQQESNPCDITRDRRYFILFVCCAPLRPYTTHRQRLQAQQK